MEPPPILYWLRVVNADAEDYGRVGMLVDMLDREDDTGLRTRYFILDFHDGQPPIAFAADEVERIYAV